MGVAQLMQQIRRLQDENLELSAQNNVLEYRLDKADGTLKETNSKLEEASRRLAKANAKEKVLETEVEVLLQRITLLTRRLAEATNTSEQLTLAIELKRLQAILESRNRELFGSKSERRPSGKNKPKTKPNPQAGHGPRKQPELPTDTQIHLLDEADTICPDCGAKLTEWGGHFDTSEEITVSRREYTVVLHKRQKYKCSASDCSHIDVALGPPRFFPGNRYSTDFAIAVAIDKYCDHLPLNRQVGRMRRSGLVVTTATLWDQIRVLYQLLLPTLLALHQEILCSPLVYADETTWRMMNGDGSKKWWVWVVHGEEGVYYLITPTRSMAAGRQLLQHYDGIVMADDFSVYNSLAGLRTRQGGVQMLLLDEDGLLELPTPDFILPTCWSHIRRYFFKAEKGGEEAASPALDLIGELYGVESEVKAAELNAEESQALRKKLRAEKSAGIIEKLDVWRRDVSPDDGTLLAKAVGHLDKVWEKAVLFLEDPLIPLDNNTAERDMRKIVLGRLNHQGSRSEEGARVSALFYSLVVTCVLLGLNPADYLRAAVDEVIKNPRTSFLPSEFKARGDAENARGDAAEASELS